MSTTPTEYQDFLNQGARSPDLLAPLTVPPSPPQVDFMLPIEGETEKEYYIRTAIARYEVEFNTTVVEEISLCQSFFRHNGHLFYYKPYLEYEITKDNANIQADLSNTTRQQNLAAVQAYLGLTVAPGASASPVSLSEIKQIIDSAPAGMPPFVQETENFYQFVDVCDKAITIDDIDRVMLDRIAATFTGNSTVYYSDLATGLYEKDGNLYFAKLQEWKKNPQKKIGIFVNPEFDSVKYPSGANNSYFLAYAPLTQDELTFVNQLNGVLTDYSEIVIMVDL